MKLLTTSQNIIECLGKINITTSEALLDYLPYKYEDNSYSDEEDLQDKQKITILGRLVSNPKHFSNHHIDIISFYFISRGNKFYNVKMFNRGYSLGSLTLGQDYTIIGTYSKDKKEISVSSFLKGELTDNKKLRSVYHLPQGLNQRTYHDLVERTFAKYQETIIDYIPKDIKTKYRLLDKSQAIKFVHFPMDEKEVSLGLRTLKYHECLAYCLKNQIIRGENKRKPNVPKVKIDTKKINEFIKKLPFTLTSDQVQAIREVILDMNNDALMYRLLQGDVGTGKTIVSTTALYGNYLRKKVGAFMVPTDSLARQQYEYLKKMFASYPIRVDLLIGSLSVKEKNIVKEKLKNGEIDILVGTHALFSSDVEYCSLGLAIIDEQHRFGVNQRNELISKDDACDLLLMSATPIPRTLALSIYGDLDISSLSEFPNAKREVETEIVSVKSPRILDVVNDCLDAKRQVFIVAPKIQTKDDTLSSAEKIYEIYHTLFKDQVRILHGRMKSEEKAEILQDFVDGKFLILVSTTVIELGINVLKAGAIIIYSASSFGLASLHQLRGRVGRDGQKASCLLVDDNLENSRLEVLKESQDGFKIAEMDMKMRGPGDVVGSAQSGFPTFACLNIIDDFRMFECARDDAAKILQNLQDSSYLTYYNKIKEDIEKQEDITLFD